MIRMFRSMGVKLYMYLIYVKYILQRNEHDLFDELRRWASIALEDAPDSEEISTIKAFIRSGRFGDLPLDFQENLESPLRSSLLAEPSQEHDKDLVDTVVRILQLSSGTSLLASEGTMRTLRKALLIPAEMNNLKRELEKKQSHCWQCGRSMQAGQLVTLQEVENELLPVCSQCVAPSIVPCTKCKDENLNQRGYAGIPNGVLTYLRKAACGKDHDTPAPDRLDPLPVGTPMDPIFRRTVITRDDVRLANENIPQPPRDFRIRGGAGVANDLRTGGRITWTQAVENPQPIEMGVIGAIPPNPVRVWLDNEIVRGDFEDVDE